MEYDPEKHHRRSIRLKEYDYAQPGAYFVTICVQNREFLLGGIVDGAMRLNEAGRMVQLWWDRLSGKFPAVEIDESMIMPNHFHGIIVIVEPGTVGANPCVRPNAWKQTPGSAPTLGEIMQWFKTMTTNAYIRGVKQDRWEPFSGRLWQRNYYEHVIRSEQELDAIRRYIHDNPTRWAQDRNNPRR